MSTSHTSSGTEFVWISRQSELEALVQTLKHESVLAIDTEFERTSTYYANAGLIQIASSQGVCLIDPLTLESLEPLGALLENPNIIKVMHSMSEDVELLRHVTRVAPRAIFDTQVAASFLGLGASLGYQKLVQEVFQIELDKAETRSNWLQRPLTAKQIDYAVADTLHLMQLYPHLKSRLEKCQLHQACLDECDYLSSLQDGAWTSPELAYLKCRGGWSLNAQQQRLLQGMIIWRDQRAQQDNVPKSWVIGDANLIEVIASNIKATGALFKLPGIKAKSVKQYGEALLAEKARVINDLKEPDHDSFVMIDAPLRGKELDVYKRCKNFVSQVEKRTGLPGQLLASRKHLEQLVVTLHRQKNHALPSFFTGWRRPYLEEGLREAVRGH